MVKPGLALALILAVQVACSEGATAGNASATSVAAMRVADSVMGADAALVSACGKGFSPTHFPPCLAAVMAEQRELASIATDVRIIESSTADNANEAGLAAGLRQGFEGLTASLTPLRSALEAGSRVHYSSQRFVARDATASLLGYALALSELARVQPAHQTTAPTNGDTERQLVSGLIAVSVLVGLIAAGFRAVRRRA